MVKLRDIFRKLYPFAIFTLPAPLSTERGGEDASRAVYLTFDDGPIPEVTTKVLAILDRYHVKATFFMVGENIHKHPEIYRMVSAAGHSIGNHSYNHIKGWWYSNHRYLRNVSRFPVDTRLFRPPYGKATLLQRWLLTRKGYTIIYWDILTRDYDARQTPEAMLALIKKRARPGSIINFHDSLKSNERMLTVLPPALDFLLSQGYTLLPL